MTAEIQEAISLLERVSTNMTYQPQSKAFIADLRQAKAVVDKCYSEIAAAQQRQLTDQQKVLRIREYVCDYFDVSPVMIVSRGRQTKYCYPRQVAFYAICHKIKREGKKGMSLKNIGYFFGGRDHTTVLHACNVIKNYIETNEEKKEEIQYILDNCLL